MKKYVKRMPSGNFGESDTEVFAIQYDESSPDAVKEFFNAIVELAGGDAKATVNMEVNGTLYLYPEKFGTQWSLVPGQWLAGTRDGVLFVMNAEDFHNDYVKYEPVEMYVGSGPMPPIYCHVEKQFGVWDSKKCRFTAVSRDRTALVLNEMDGIYEVDISRTGYIQSLMDEKKALLDLAGELLQAFKQGKAVEKLPGIACRMNETYRKTTGAKIRLDD